MIEVKCSHVYTSTHAFIFLQSWKLFKRQVQLGNLIRYPSTTVRQRRKPVCNITRKGNMKVKAPSPLGLIDRRLRPDLTRQKPELLDYLQHVARLPLFYLLPSVLRRHRTSEDLPIHRAKTHQENGGKQTQID